MNIYLNLSYKRHTDKLYLLHSLYYCDYVTTMLDQG